jgi:hypothetical protein
MYRAGRIRLFSATDRLVSLVATSERALVCVALDECEDMRRCALGEPVTTELSVRPGHVLFATKNTLFSWDSFHPAKALLTMDDLREKCEPVPPGARFFGHLSSSGTTVSCELAMPGEPAALMTLDVLQGNVRLFRLNGAPSSEFAAANDLICYVEQARGKCHLVIARDSARIVSRHEVSRYWYHLAISPCSTKVLLSANCCQSPGIAIYDMSTRQERTLPFDGLAARWYGSDRIVCLLPTGELAFSSSDGAVVSVVETAGINGAPLASLRPPSVGASGWVVFPVCVASPSGDILALGCCNPSRTAFRLVHHYAASAGVMATAVGSA